MDKLLSRKKDPAHDACTPQTCPSSEPSSCTVCCDVTSNAHGTYSHDALLLLDSVDAQRADRLADAAEVLVDVWVDLLGLCAVKLMQQLLLVVVGKQGLRLATVGS